MAVPSVNVGSVQVSPLMPIDAVTALPWPSDPLVPFRFLNAQCSLRDLYGGRALIMRSSPSGPVLDIADTQLQEDAIATGGWLSRCKWNFKDDTNQMDIAFDDGCQAYPEYAFDKHYWVDLAAANGVLGARASLGEHILLLFATIVNGGLMCHPAELFLDFEDSANQYNLKIAAALAEKLIQADVAQVIARALLCANGPILVPMAGDSSRWMLLPSFANTGIRIMFGLSSITAQLDALHTICLDTVYLALDVLT